MKAKKIGKRQIYKKLLLSYFLFAFLSVLAIVIGMYVIMLIMGRGDTNNIIPDQMVGEDGQITNPDLILASGGWIEELDYENRVMRVIGEKKVEDNYYSYQELLRISGSHDQRGDYSVFYVTGGHKYYLIYIPTDSLTITYSYSVQTMISSNRQKLILVLIGIFLILEAILFSRYIYKKIQYPLDKLTTAFSKTETGDRDFNLDFKAEGEFIELRDAYNSMVKNIADQESENEKLQSAQRRLILELSHDLQTPIATIEACASALSDDIVSEDEKKKYYDIIASKAERVSSMTEDMFTLLKMENPGYKPVFSRVDVCEFMRRIISDNYDDIERNSFELNVDIPEDPVFINADEGLMQRAVGNLISNAVKYNRSGHEIGVAVKPVGGQVSVRVWDDGDAINPEFTGIMFDAFSRYDAARISSGSTGLGLTIAREITEKHGGSISYEYEDDKNVMKILLPTA
ncbi:MAG: HAMP domain-containing histidine kinase [Lachnospiraceae bacterium]|nr:HAMP domain-containing histidine kinase [Lachnospiraceae bacterium]